MYINFKQARRPLEEEKAEDEGLICSGRKKAQEKNGEEEERTTKSFFCELYVKLQEKRKPGRPGGERQTHYSGREGEEEL